MFFRINSQFGVLSIRSAVKMLALCFASLLLLSCSGESTENNAVQHLKQAEAYMNSGQYRAAMIEARNAIQKAPADQAGYVASAEISNELGGFANSIKVLESLKGASGKDYIFALTKAYIGRSKFSSASQFLASHAQEAKKADPIGYEILLAEIAVGKGEFDEAIRHFEAAQKLSPKNVDALLGLAGIYNFKKMGPHLDEMLAQLDALDESSPKIYAFKARLAFDKNDLETSERMLTEALALLPSSDLMTPLRAGVMSLLAEVLTRSGRSAEALVYTRVLADAFPGAELSKGKYKEAINLFDSGDLDGAEKKLLELLEQVPGNEKASQLLGVINYMQGDLEEAGQYFEGNFDAELATDKLQQVFAMTSMRLNKPEEVLKLLEGTIEDTKSAETLGLYGFAALSAGKEQEGVDALTKAAKLDPSKSRIHLALAGYYNSRTQPNYAEALKYVEKAYNQNNKDSLIQKSLLQQYLVMEKVSHAKKLIDEILKNHGDAFASHILAGNFSDTQKKPDEALKYYLKALDLAPEQPVVLETVGKAYIRQQRWSSAEKTFKKYIDIAPDSLTGYQGVMYSASKLGKIKDALAYISQSNQGKENPSIAPYIALGRYYSSAKQFDEARKNQQLAAKISPDNAYVKRLSAAISYSEGLEAKNKGDFDKARELAFNGLKNAPNHILLLTLLAETEIANKRFKEAEKIIKQIFAEDKPVANHLNGDLLSAQGKRADALPFYKDSWAARPNELLASKLYRLHMGLKSEPEAVAMLNTWVEKFPSSVKALAARGTHYITAKDYNKAKVDLQKATAIAPESPVLLNNLAWVLHELKDKSAEEMASKAAKLAPKSPPILDTYGWILHQNGKTKDALPYLKKANELAPDNEEIKQHLSAAMDE